MEQHPIPRQITTFEFKLIGFLTIKQFIYLIVFIPVGFLVYYLFPIPLINILLGIITGGLGFAFAFIPVNDRPLDVWIKNFFKRLTSPTKYLYHKANQPLYFLRNLYFVSDPHRVLAHIEAQEKLNQYLATKTPPVLSTQKKQSINNLFFGEFVSFVKKRRLNQLIKRTKPLLLHQYHLNQHQMFSRQLLKFLKNLFLLELLKITSLFLFRESLFM